MLTRCGRYGRGIAVTLLAAAITTVLPESGALASGAAATAAKSSAGSALMHELSQAWQVSTGRGVTVAILSDGVDPAAVGLAGKVTTGPNYIPKSAATSVSGTVLATGIAASGATTSSPYNPIGRAPGAKILSIRVYADVRSRASTYDGNGTWQINLAKGIRYAASHGASVIVADMSGTASDYVLDSAVSYAAAHGAVVITSGDMASGSAAEYPAAIPGVIDVAAVTVPGLPAPIKRSPKSADSYVTISAPANTLAVTGPGNNPYQIFNAFSAIDWVASTAAIVKSVYPHLTPALVVRAIAMSATGRPAGGFSHRDGFGLVDPIGALRAAARLSGLHQPSGSGPGLVSASARLGTGPAPGVIAAVRHSAVTLAGFGAAIVVGLVLLAFAAWRLVAGRRRRAAGQDGQEGAEPTPATAA